LSIAQFDLQDPTAAGADLLQDDSIQPASVHLAAAQIAGGRFLFVGGSQPQLALDQLDGPLSVTQVNGQAASVNQLLTLPSGALLRVNSNGSFRYDPHGGFASLALGATATEAFTYEVSDREGATATATARITVTGVNDAPADRDRTVHVFEDQGGGQTQPQLDVDGDPITYAVVTPPLHGAVVIQGGKLIYLPAANYNGPDSFTFQGTDGTLESPVYTYSIVVLPVNDAPVAQAQAATTAEDTAVAITLSAPDVDGDVVSYTVMSGPTHGSLSGTAPHLVYLPAADYYGPDAFTFAAGDDEAVSAVALVNLSVTDALMELVSLSPASADAGGSGFTLTATGSGFEPDTVVYWNGAARPTAYVSATQVTAEISASDLAIDTDLQTVPVTVGEPTGSESRVAIFAIVPATVGGVQALVVPAGGSGSVSFLPTSSTESGVTVSVQNDGGGSVTAVAATYDTKPTGETAFKVDGGSFVDVQFTGVDSSDVATVSFYYPAAIMGGAENKVKLRYFDGANWIPVLGSGGLAPVRDTADNLDGTLSGGRFVVVFDGSSTPRLTELTGTVFGMIDSTPQIGTVSGPAGPAPLGAAVTVSVSYAVAADPMGVEVTFVWDDGIQTTTAPSATGFASSAHLYAAPGVYGVTVRVMDGEGDLREGRFEYGVIYDPSGGFVTGAGWIHSPAGACVFDPTLAGKATFGFNSKYLKGKTVPTGETQFQFQAGDFRFHSTAYEWLVVSGARAQYKGAGQVNGTGDYGFLLTAADSQFSGGGGADRFRIKIWDKASAGLVYDNRLGISDDVDSADPQAIAGGSIVIHKHK
jgi:hypothetical protein